MKLFVDGEEINDSGFDSVIVRVEAWYDRHTRDYCIQCLNKDGYQVGDAIRVGDKESKRKVVEDLRREYGV